MCALARPAQPPADLRRGFGAVPLSARANTVCTWRGAVKSHAWHTRCPTRSRRAGRAQPAWPL